MTAEAFGVDVVGRFHGMDVQIWDLTDPFLAAVLVFLMLRRLLQSLERQRQMALDVKQAQEVQQVILPEARTTLPGLLIESEYRPAREVGGDFFQIIPQASDGSLLIVAGDVCGKGLKAGMLVALLVGVIRTAADFDSSPEFILDALNRRLLGRGHAQATCLAMRIEHEGSVTLANAGHLPPYLNGIPVEIEGSLPLGVVEQLECSVHHFFMTETDRLLLLSDGVAEATNKEGKLFGFERVLELVRTESTAAKIAETAQAFGQEDDITVIAVTKMAIVEPAMA
jgi:serine phosphatase RsbU (regulator of sigma subunit)